MKIYTKLLIIIAILIVSSHNTKAIEKDICIGVGAGYFSFDYYDVYNYKYEYNGGLFGVNAIFTNLFGKGVTPELSINSMYGENVVTGLDFRVRYYPWSQKKFAPYGFIGLGYYSWDEYYTTSKQAYLPIGVGLTHFFTPKVGADLNLGYNVSDPVIFTAKLSVLFRVASWGGEPDRDEDGLSDADEAKYKTNPDNPDSDNDGLLDGKEVNKYKTDPNNADTDNGGISDGIEITHGADPLDKDDDILSIDIGNKLILRGIEFETGKTDISPRSERILNFALKALKKADEMEIEICGHTDDVGKPQDNVRLSEDRAKAVKKWFVDKGISEYRISTRGAGSSEPLVPNTNDENRQRNRRVEFYRTK